MHTTCVVRHHPTTSASPLCRLCFHMAGEVIQEFFNLHFPLQWEEVEMCSTYLYTVYAGDLLGILARPARRNKYRLKKLYFCLFIYQTLLMLKYCTYSKDNEPVNTFNTTYR